MTSAGDSLLAAADAARAGAGVIAARHRRDLASANTLVSGLDDRAGAAGFLLLADLGVTLLARLEGRPVDEAVADLSLQIAAQTSSI